MIFNGILSYLDHHQTKVWWDKSVQDAFDSVLTALCFDINDWDVAEVTNTLILSRNKHLFEAIDLAVYMKEGGDIFTPEVSKNICYCIKDVVASVWEYYSHKEESSNLDTEGYKF